ncbi:MAG TPA: tetratricopeptide repeat protein [Gemmatimonadales bacterium]|nr:tetratricopeptide repeat protein [Gemmatimonadales bacterium]
MSATPDQLIGQARARMAVQDYYGAIHLLEEVVALGHRFADVHHLLGLCYSFLGRNEEALPHYDRAIELNPRYFEAHIHRGLALNELGRSEEAQDAFRRAAAAETITPSGLSSHVAAALANEHARLGEAYVEAGLIREAVEQYRKAVELAPGFADLRYRLGRLLLECGQTLAARDHLARVAAERPRWIEARATLGLACFLSGDTAGAREVWTACLVEHPGEPRVEAYLAMLERAG